MQLKLNENGQILQLSGNGVNVPFLSENGFGFGYVYADKIFRITLNKNIENEGFSTENCGIFYNLSYDVLQGKINMNLTIENRSNYDFYADNIFFELGVNSYMESYPEWSDKFFPTLLRLEKTHFYGYFQSPEGNALIIAGNNGIPAYDISYAHPSTPHLNNGHRIYNTILHLYNNSKPLDRLPQDKLILKVGEKYTNTISLIPVKSLCNFEKTVSSAINAPIISAEKYTVEKGESLAFNVDYNGNYNYTIIAPKGEVYKNELPLTNTYGLYKLTVVADNGKQAESLFFVRKSWEFYLKGASKEAYNKPQKATTHTESWYGYFSIFLAQKHYGNKKSLEKALQNFNEVMPFCFDFESGNPLIIPNRVQNTSAFISLLVDVYETDKVNNLKYLRLASKCGDFLIKNQTPDGAYRRGKTHYTCVIYVAKSMLELVKAERECNDLELNKKAETHYASAKLAIDELVLHLDNIDTEGELTFEDGMISCSALQIAYFALTLPKNERAPYIKAAEYMIKIHSCLEQQLLPDCRANGGSIRFWESQYDVMILGNTVNSPHGWSAWTLYAYYYLFVLTGKKFYLLRLINGMSACAQLLSLQGKLRWAYFSQPYVKLPTLVADKTKPITDGYSTVNLKTKAYRGKYQTKIYGESYVDMISGWYRTGSQKVTGGYSFCPLFMPDNVYKVDNQGGCCDNDVHEIFKCLEEAVLTNAFICQNDDGSYLTLNCKVINDELVLTEKVNNLVYSVKVETTLNFNGKTLTLKDFNTISL